MKAVESRAERKETGATNRSNKQPERPDDGRSGQIGKRRRFKEQQSACGGEKHGD